MAATPTEEETEFHVTRSGRGWGFPPGSIAKKTPNIVLNGSQELFTPTRWEETVQEQTAPTSPPKSPLKKEKVVDVLKKQAEEEMNRKQEKKDSPRPFLSDDTNSPIQYKSTISKKK
jgi:hypothetical protein